MASQTVEALIQLHNRLKSSDSPCSVVAGIVIEGGNSPTIGYDELHPIPKILIDIPRELSDYKTTIEIDGEIKEITVRNHLETGDSVFMIRDDGGQRHLVIGRMG